MLKRHGTDWVARGRGDHGRRRVASLDQSVGQVHDTCFERNCCQRPPGARAEANVSPNVRVRYVYHASVLVGRHPVPHEGHGRSVTTENKLRSTDMVRAMAVSVHWRCVFTLRCRSVPQKMTSTAEGHEVAVHVERTERRMRREDRLRGCLWRSEVRERIAVEH